MRPVDVVQPYQDNGQLEAVRERRHHTLCRRLCGSVWIGWINTCVLFEIVRIHTDFAVHLGSERKYTNGYYRFVVAPTSSVEI